MQDAEKRALLVQTLHTDFPDFDMSLIGGMLDDQGGDIDEVKGYLQVCQDILSEFS